MGEQEECLNIGGHSHLSMNNRLSWEEYALALAKVASSRSQDPFLQVGACALRYDHSVAAVGYNGPPPGIDIDWSDRDERRKRISHAENSCLRYVKPGECYLIAVTLSPCTNCVVQIASYGIKKIIYGEEYDKGENWKELAAEFKLEVIKL